MSKNFSTGAKYLRWSILTIILQTRNDRSSRADLLLSLAERQLSTYYSKQAKEEAEKVDKSNGKLEIRPGFEDAHEFQLATRLLEIMAEREVRADQGGEGKGRLQVRAPVLPTLPDTLPLSIRECLVAHIDSQEADHWCQTGLGFELNRREIVLKYGSRESWLRHRERLVRTLEDGDTNWHTMLFAIRLTLAAVDAQQSTWPDPLTTDLRDVFVRLSDSERGRKERGYLLAQLEMGKSARQRAREERECRHSIQTNDCLFKYCS